METDGYSNNPYPQGGTATIDPPQFNAAGTQLKLEAKSVKSAAQAFNICKSLEYENRQRALRCSDMQSLHDGAPPNSAGQNTAKMASWQANTSTLWLAGIVGRVSQRFVNAIISQTYVTASALPTNYADWKTKSDFMRAKFTSLVRGWDGNTGFINAVATEVCLQGYAFSLFLDPFTWLPSFFKQEDCLIPNKSLQHARELQFFAARRDFRLDKFIDLFRDEEAAKTAGYDVDNCLEAANKAVVRDPRADAATTQFRNFVDMIDEGSIGIATTGSGERVVKTWMLFNREYDGQVSFWLLERDSGKQLRFSFKLFPRMQDVMTIFSFEAGNGTTHSSKGLGRKLASLAVMKELFRCGIIDNARMAGMTILYMSGADATKFKPAMAAPFIILDSSIKVAEHQFEVSAESYRIVDTLIDSWAEQAVGAYLAAQITDKGRTERTATEATIDARRENEASDIMIRRCLDQDATRIQMQQLRVCSDENIRKARRLYDKLTQDPEADPEKIFPEDVDEANLMRFLVECMQFPLTDDEIKVWSKSQASAFAHVTEGAIQRGVEAVAATMKDSPNINHSELDRVRLEGFVGADMSRRLYVPTANTTTAIEAERKQQMESLAMAQSGLPIAVSPRDNHMGEIPTVMSLLQNVMAPVLSRANPSPEALKTAELNLNHMGEHLKFAAQQGDNKLPVFKEYDKFYEGFKKQLAEVVQINTDAQVAQQAVEQSIRQETTPLATPPATPPLTPDIPGDFQTGDLAVGPASEPALVPA